MRVSIIVPVRDDTRVAGCVDSIRRAIACATDAEAELIVVDNGSSLDVASLVGTKDLTVITEPLKGPFRARNLGVEQATGDVIFFTDAPCEVHPDWLTSGLKALYSSGADIVQGFSGSVANGLSDRLIQSHYEARYRDRPAGSPVECDTRNLAVRREVFEKLRFNDRRQRVSDTEFGLTAESMGFRVAYAPLMRVDHHHDASLALYLSKQVVHGWGAQRLMREMPHLRWHSGKPDLAARVARFVARFVPGVVLDGLARIVAFGGGVIQRGGLPLPVVRAAFMTLDKLALLLGHVMFESGRSEDELMRAVTSRTEALRR